MAYTTTFSDLLGVDLGPFLVYSYGMDAIRFHGDRAALDIGVFGEAGMVGDGGGIADVEQMRAQIGAAKEAGLARIHAYSLDGVVGLGNGTEWYEAFQAPASLPDGESNVILFRSGLRLVDALL
ncbi:MAG: hypothetical protein AB1640_23985 [bacterium]